MIRCPVIRRSRQIGGKWKVRQILQRLRQLFRERALRTIRSPLHPAGAAFAPPGRTLIHHRSARRHRRSLARCSRATGRCRPMTGRNRSMLTRPRRTMLRPAFRSPLRPFPRPRRTLRLWRLRRIRAQQTILKRCPIETADYGVHLFGIRRFDERESLGLLCFRIADNLDCICNQVFGCQPALDIVRGYPNGQIAQKDRKTHSVVVFDSIGGGLARVRCSLGHYQRITPSNGGKQKLRNLFIYGTSIQSGDLQ
jgi:hypothetical protein